MTRVSGEPLDHTTISCGARAADTLAALLQALAAMKCRFLTLKGQNGDRGLPGGKPN